MTATTTRQALGIALRQWKMYAEMQEEESLETAKHPEGDLYRDCLAALSPPVADVDLNWVPHFYAEIMDGKIKSSFNVEKYAIEEKGFIDFANTLIVKTPFGMKAAAIDHLHAQGMIGGNNHKPDDVGALLEKGNAAIETAKTLGLSNIETKAMLGETLWSAIQAALEERM